MDKFLSGLKNLTTKAKETLKDIVSVDASEAKPSPVERAGQTVQDWFKKDDIKPIPNDGKAYIAPAKRTTGQKIMDTLRSNDTINDILTGFIGDGSDDYFKGKVDGKDYSKGIESFLPKQGEGLIEYLLPEVTKDETTRILDRYDALREKGVSEERASKVAVEDVRKPKAGSVEAFLAQQRGEKQDITPEEEEALKGTKLREKLGLALDVVGNTPLGFVAKKGEKEVVKKVIEEGLEQIEKKGAEKATNKGVKTAGEVLEEQGGMDRFMNNGGGKGTAKKVAEGASEGGDKTRRFITRTESMAPEAKDLLKGKYTPKKNEDLIKEADDLIKASRAEAETIAKTDSSDRGVAVASRLIDTLTKEGRAGNDLAYEKLAEIANEAARNLTEAGRSVQAARILGRMTPEGMVRYAARKIQEHNEIVAKSKGAGRLGDLFGGYGKKLEKIPELTPDEVKFIQTEMDRIRDITDDIERARAFQLFNRKMSERIPSSLYNKIATLWKAGLLTGLKTTGLNILSNASHALTEGIKDIPAGLVDRIASLFTGKRTLATTLRGVPSGAKEGVAKGWDYFKSGFDERDIGGKLDYEIVNFGKGKLAKALQKYEEGVFRFIGSQDQPFYYGAKARSLYSQAIAEARNKGLYGEEAVKFVNDLVANPTEEMLKYATLDAETAVFQNATELGKLGKAIQNMPIGKFILPFAKTPAAVATQVINYSPVGIVKTIAENIGRGKFDQRLFSQGIGRGLTGTGIMYLGSLMYDNGMMNLSRPTSEKEQNQWDLEGRQANSIKIGDKWVSVAVLGPVGLALLVGGAYRKAYDEAGSVTKGLLQATLGGLKSFNEQTFLKGVNQFTNALSDPGRYGETFLSSFVGSWVPTIIADVARALDDVERRTPGIKERLYSRIPGLRETLEPQVNTFGEEVKTPSGLRVMIDATRSKDIIEGDGVTKELRRLLDAGYNVTPTMLGPKDGYKSLTPELNTALLKFSGQKEKRGIEEIMQSKAYKKSDDELKAKLVQKVVDQAKVEARGRAVYEAVKDLPEARRIQKLKEMRDEKLLTKQVYAYYLSIKKKEEKKK